jgi:hypothetical protein
MKGSLTYKNLLDILIQYESDPDLSGKTDDQFRKLLTDYFFARESEEKTMLNVFKNFEIPPFLKNYQSLREIPTEEWNNYIENEIPNQSFSGKIMMSKGYLKTFYSNHQPEFSKIPSDIQLEILDKVNAKNESILNAFMKVQNDIEADKKRTVFILTVLILNNIRIRQGIQFNKVNEPVDALIKSKLLKPDMIFDGTPQSMVDFNDDTKVKLFIKTFFPVKQHKDMVIYSGLFKTEVERFKKRAVLLR